MRIVQESAGGEDSVKTNDRVREIEGVSSGDDNIRDKRGKNKYQHPKAGRRKKKLADKYVADKLPWAKPNRRPVL
jgi:hypothetical protein